MVIKDVTLELTDIGTIAHRPDCPRVQALRAAALPLMTLFDCQNSLPLDVELCSCLRTTREVNGR